jgi:GT2 family glycosyltransferase
MTRLRIVIVNWNAGHLLRDCLTSISSSKYSNFELEQVVVVDNNSTDASLDGLETIGLPLKVIRNSKNLGFAAACNQGAQGFEGNYILFLNPDTRLYLQSLSIPIDFMEESIYADVGICGVQLIDESGHVARSCARFPTAVGFLAHSIGVDRLFPTIGHFMAEWSHDHTAHVDHVIGAFYLVRRELFECLQGFDEQYFVYLEDLDFSYRAWKSGWRTVYFTDAQAFHAGGGTSNQIKARRLFYSLRSRLIYAFKYFSWIGAILVLLSTLLVEPMVRSALAVARRSWTSFKETWQGYGMLWCWLPQWWFKGLTR